tara:strand:- start:1310 stop:1471 length:162 start_codon:yes stop_codon:yes gene_type:complete
MQNLNSQLLTKVTIKKQSNFKNFVNALIYFLCVIASGLALGVLALEAIVFLTN